MLLCLPRTRRKINPDTPTLSDRIRRGDIRAPELREFGTASARHVERRRPQLTIELNQTHADDFEQ